jgi:hypothetical protein
VILADSGKDETDGEFGDGLGRIGRDVGNFEAQ